MKPPVLLPLLLLLLAGCQKPPQVDIDAARSALGEAQAAGAAQYAPDALATAVAAATELDTEVLAQSRRGPGARRYEATAELAAALHGAAQEAKEEAEAARERLRVQLAPELPALADAIPAAQALLAGAQKVRGVRLDSTALGAEIEAIANLVSDASAAYDAGRFADAASLSIEAKQRLDGLQKQVQEAIDLVRPAAGRRS
jgi:hypothetical protein